VLLHTKFAAVTNLEEGQFLACCRKLGEFSSTARRNSKTNIFNKKRQNLNPEKEASN
jgi:hypothetical protein